MLHVGAGVVSSDKGKAIQWALALALTLSAL